MTGTTVIRNYDSALEEQAMRKAGMLGSGRNAHQLMAMSYNSLPPEAKTTIARIISGGPFPYPVKDGSNFGNRYGDLPSGRYLEYTVATPHCRTRGARRIVARKSTGQIFFTACHYERFQARGGSRADKNTAIEAAQATEDADYQNGFYIVTGMDAEMRSKLVSAIKAVS